MKEANIIVKTPRLILRELQDKDFDFLFRIFNDPEVMKFYDGLRNEDQTRSWMKLTYENYHKYGHGKWIIEDALSSKALGHTGLLKIKVDGIEETELGYFLSRDAWGKGYATEAAQAAMMVGFDKFNFPKIISAINPSNLPSIEVALRIGMKKERTGIAQAGETTWECDVYSISKNDGIGS